MGNRKLVISANWKMNKTPKETKELISDLLSLLKEHKSRIILFVPYVDLSIARECVLNTDIEIGAQNCHWESFGAFTGEISVNMLKELGINSVIIGHSERRKYFNETDETINKKIKLLIRSKMNAVLCVGETLEQMKSGATINVISNQLQKALSGIKKEEMSNIIIAYEPVWAIGTGISATPEQAGKICGEIRKIINKIYDEGVAEKIIIQYGGSINTKNIEAILSTKEIDGGLIGGASLKPSEFVKIVELADKVNYKE